MTLQHIPEAEKFPPRVSLQTSRVYSLPWYQESTSQSEEHRVGVLFVLFVGSAWKEKVEWPTLCWSVPLCIQQGLMGAGHCPYILTAFPVLVSVYRGKGLIWRWYFREEEGLNKWGQWWWARTKIKCEKSHSGLSSRTPGSSPDLLAAQYRQSLISALESGEFIPL